MKSSWKLKKKTDKLNEILQDLNAKEKVEMLLAMQQQILSDTTKTSTENAVLIGNDYAYLYLYNQYLKPIQKNKNLSEPQQQELLHKMVDFIIKKYAEAEIRTKKLKAKASNENNKND